MTESRRYLSGKKSKHLYLHRAEFWSRIIARLPGVEAVFLTGSLSHGRGTDQSDIDYFIVARKGRIFTARFWVLVVLLSCGRLAMNADTHAGKICPNHFVTEDNLMIAERSLPFAYLYSKSKFLAGNPELWELFKKLNQPWMLAHGHGFDQVVERCISIQSRECSTVGNLFERSVYLLQKYKMKTNKLEMPNEARVWLNTDEIRCHPDHAEISRRYQKNILLEKNEQISTHQ